MHSILQGETVPYIICVERTEDGQGLKEGSKGLAERAHHPDELRESSTLTVDANYYLSNQVGPPTAIYFDFCSQYYDTAHSASPVFCAQGEMG